MVLDLGLAGVDGLEVARRIRKESDTPILMVTARSGESDKLLGFEIGADDYVTKPFSTAELVARVRVLLRRSTGAVERTLEVGGLKIDPARRTVERDGTAIPLTTLEFDLLYLMASRPGRVFSREALMEQVWGTDRVVDDRSIDSLVSRLRRKLEADASNHAISRPSGERGTGSPSPRREPSAAEPLLDDRGSLLPHRGRRIAHPGIRRGRRAATARGARGALAGGAGAAGAAAEIAALADPITDPKVHEVLARTRERMGFRGSSIVYRGADGHHLRAAAPGGSVLRSRRATRFARDGSGSSDSRCWPAPRAARRQGPRRGRGASLASARGMGLPEARTAVLFVPFAVLVSALAGLVLVRLLVRRLRSIEVLASRRPGGPLRAHPGPAETRSDGWRGSWTA